MQEEVQVAYPARHLVVRTGSVELVVEEVFLVTTCDSPLRGCKYKPPHSSIHHKYWPSTWYQSGLERRFREHPDNKVRLCRCLHDLEHLKKPPKKPSRAFMEEFLNTRPTVT